MVLKANVLKKSLKLRDKNLLKDLCALVIKLKLKFMLTQD